MSNDITMNEWLAELAKLESEQPEGATMREICGALGVSERVGRRMVRQMMEAGAVVCSGLRRMQDMSGRPNAAPVYRLVKKNGGKKK